MFKIQYPDGSFSLGGTPDTYSHSGYYFRDGIYFPANKGGKIWNKIEHLKNHLRILEHYDYKTYELISDIDKIKDAVVIEYELVEKRRMTVAEFVGEKDA